MTATSRPGPRRPATLPDAQLDALIAHAIQLGTEVEAHRQAMSTAAIKRQQVIRRAYAAGLSVRDLAARLGLTASTVQKILAK